MSFLYPIGYGTRMGTIDEVIAFLRRGPVEPEYEERLVAWLVSREGAMGPGGAFRLVQPDKSGFAPAGKSFHEKQTFVDGRGFYMAVDLVHVNPGTVHRAPRWAEVPQQGTGHSDISTYGVHCNVGGEPWHMQAIEVDGWLPWVNRGRPYPNPNFVLPGWVEPPVPPTQPPVETGAIIVEFSSRSLIEGTTGNDVKWLQNKLNRLAGQGLDTDGQFGPRTTQAVKNWQTFFGLTADGQAGGKTQRSIIEVELQTGQ